MVVTNTDLAKRIKNLEKELGSRIDAVGRITMDTQASVNALKDWQKETLLEAKIRKELAGDSPKSADNKVILNLIKLLTVAIGAILALAGYKAVT